MGMGEPLFNYDNLIKAIHILRDRYGLNFPTDGITISTVGPVDQLKKLREEHLKIQLTISLHAATQSARNRIIPHMRIYAIEDVVKQALSYSERHNRKIVFAYLLYVYLFLIVNDSNHRKLKKEPIAETITSGSYKSTACPVIINISTPNASPERIIVPKFPLLEGLSNNTIMDWKITQHFLTCLPSFQ